MKEWAVWFVRSAATLFMLSLAAVLAIFTCVAQEKWFPGLFAAALGFAGWISWPRMPNAWRRDPPTQKQIVYATNLGIRIPRGATKGQLSDLISKVTGR